MGISDDMGISEFTDIFLRYDATGFLPRLRLPAGLLDGVVYVGLQNGLFEVRHDRLEPQYLYDETEIAINMQNQCLAEIYQVWDEFFADCVAFRMMQTKK